MRTVIFGTPAEQERGLQHRAAIEPHTLFAFPGIRAGAVFHSRNVPEAFDLAFLSKDWKVLWSGTLVPEADMAAAPAGTALALESRAGMMKAVGLTAGAFVPPS
jgi:uncharacterized membrane protein (UPF0127 family)